MTQSNEISHVQSDAENAPSVNIHNAMLWTNFDLLTLLLVKIIFLWTSQIFLSKISSASKLSMFHYQVSWMVKTPSSHALYEDHK